MVNHKKLEEEIIPAPPIELLNEDLEIQEDSTPSSLSTKNEELTALLEKLDAEEKLLMQEKTDLLSVEEQLTQKIKAEIEAKKSKIDGLKSEIPELRQKCEGLATVLGIQVQK